MVSGWCTTLVAGVADFPGVAVARPLMPCEASHTCFHCFTHSLLQIALTVFYNTPTGGYASTFFNRTVDIIEPPSYIDTQLLFLWLLLLAGLGAAGEPQNPKP